MQESDCMERWYLFLKKTMFLFLAKGKTGTQHPKTILMSFLVLSTMMEGNVVLMSAACQMKHSFYINLGKCRLKNQRAFISSILATINKSNNNLIFCHYCWFPSCKTLPENWTVLLFWGANQFHTSNGFLDIKNVKILPY